MSLKNFFTFKKEQGFDFKKNIHFWLPPVVFVLVLIGLIIFLPNGPIKKIIKKTKWDNLVRPHYVQAYELVSGTISQSANVVVNLPADSQATASDIKFTPEIVGEWLASAEKNKLIFKPKEKLELNKYYTVTLNAKEGVIGKDFLVAEDPAISAVFPKEGSETHEKSDITIIFNRPMVPLTSLDVLEEKTLPIEIQPATTGRFKWIGTRTLQFIPETQLIASANYTVKIKDGLTAVDGLSINQTEHKFITRPLRYNYFHEGATVYNRPISIYFNQPVNLEKTIKEIFLKNDTTGQQVDFIAEYGKKKVYSQETKKMVEQTDESLVLVYNKQDKYNRAKFWDFKNNYYFRLQKAYPKDGDIILDQQKELWLQVSDVVKNYRASSERSDDVNPDFFDPQGKLLVEFYEEIDLNKSKIKADKLVDIKYAEKCRGADNADFYFSSELECEKEPDKTTIELTFDSAKISKGEVLGLELSKIVNITGLKINSEVIIKEIKTVPALKAFSPDDVVGSKVFNASLDNFIICSNTPLVNPAKENIDNYLKVNLDYNFINWPSSYLVDRDSDVCAKGQFVSRLYYKLIPESDYRLEFKLVDRFASKSDNAWGFRTMAMPNIYLNFYHLQKNYSVATPDKIRLTYAGENMEFVDVHICQLSAEKMLHYLSDQPNYWEGPQAVNGCLKTITKKIELPKKYWVKNYFKVDLKDYFPEPLGHYLLTFSNPNYKERRGDNPRQVYERSYVSVTNLGVVEKQVQARDSYNFPKEELFKKQLNQLNNLYWITSLKTLEPISKAKIDLYIREKNNNGTPTSDNRYNKTVYTDNQGVAQATVDPLLSGAIISAGDDSAILLKQHSYLGNWYGSSSNMNDKVYLYTDRPIYRPGHEVQMKGLYRLGYDGNYQIFKDKKVAVKVFDSANKEIFSQELEVNDFGTFNATVQLDTQAPLGQYRIKALNNYSFFEVEEYVPAPFKVETKTDKEEYISGDTFNLDLDANYYFGAPVDGGEVKYRISSQNYYFDKYQEEYFNFGNDWYYCYNGCSYGDKFILQNKVKLNSDGKAKISHQLDINKLFPKEEEQSSKIFVVYATVKNSNGQAVTAQKSFIVHRGDFYLGLKTDKYFVGKKEKFKIKTKSVDTTGKNLAVKNIELSISKISWVTSKRNEVDGNYYSRWEKKLTEVTKEKINTDKEGNWQGDFSLDKEGEYEVKVKAIDERGNVIKNNYTIYVWGEGSADIAPNNNDSLEIVANNKSVEVGKQASFIIKSPYPQAKALITVERGQIFKYEIVDIKQNLFTYNFPITEDYIPNIYASVALISSKPEIKYGNTYFEVNSKEKKLNIEVKPSKDHYLPGEEVSLDFTVKDSKNRPVSAEFSVAVADLSVLALKGNPKKNPTMFFYNNFPLAVDTSSNIKNILFEADVPVSTKGGSGAESEDLAKKKRGLFKDTAWWQAVLQTDKDGKAQAKFTLPDNLTTWQVETVGITQDTKLGVDYREFMARKEIMVTPLKPRFVVPGDQFLIGAKVFNQTKENQKLTISFNSDSLILDDQQQKEINLTAEQTTNIYFKVSAPAQQQDGVHKFVLSVKNSNYEDTVENSINITRNDTYEATATSGYTKENTANEYLYLPDNIVKDKGQLTINHSATLAVFLTDGLNYLLNYPYGCSEQVASKLNAIAVIKRGLNLKNVGDKLALKNEVEFDGKKYTLDEAVALSLARLYQNQTGDGGFAYYANLQSNPYLTLHVVSVLNNLKQAGYQINDDSINRAYDYLINQLSYNKNLLRDHNFLITASYILNVELGKNLNDNLIKKINGFINDEKFINEEVSNTSLTHLAMLLVKNQKTFGEKMKNKVYDILENKIEIDSRGAFLPVGKNMMWQYYETSVKDSALLLQALILDKRDNQILDRLLRWLLRSRDKDGAWGSTNNTLSAVSAMTDYLIWQKETESNFTLDIQIDGQNKTSFNYEPATILTQNSLVTPIKDLPFGKMTAINFNKTNHNNLANNFYYDMSLKYYLPIDNIAPRDEGFTITRSFYDLQDEDDLTPLTNAKVGEVLRGHLEIIVPKDRNMTAIEDFIPAGFELVNFNLATEDQSLLLEKNNQRPESFYQDYQDDWLRAWKRSVSLSPDITEMRDDRLFLFRQYLPAGTYKFDYYIRALVPGKFNHLPAVVSEMYSPENFGRTRGEYFEVGE